MYLQAYVDSLEHYSIDVTVRNRFLAAVECELQSLYSQLCSSNLGSRSIYTQRIASLRLRISELVMNRTCLTCLYRMPEKTLCCGHAICEVCLVTFGSSDTLDRYTYRLKACPLYGIVKEEGQTFRLSLPTAGTRLLTIDGGGIRGVIPLTFLVALEGYLAPFKSPL